MTTPRLPRLPFSAHAALAGIGALFLVGLSGCAGASYEAQAPQQEYASIDGRSERPMDDTSGLPPAGQGVQGQRLNGGDVAIGADTSTYADTDPSAVTEFREPLAPYGTWVDDGTYGTVWVPHAHVVGADFTPYATAGHWAYDDDWVWVSDYSWGWAPFHYGRWTYIGHRGWAWIPGRTYRGAWVTWRTGPYGYGYVGWAPMAPSWYWYNGYAYGLYAIPPSPYVFCRTEHVFAANGVHTHIVRGPEVANIGAGTKPHTPASPSVDPHVAAKPSVGPNPETLGLTNGQIARVPAGNPGLAKAQAYAQPATAIKQGAAPPGSMNYAEPRSMATRTITGASVARAPVFTPSTDLTRSASTPTYSSARPTDMNGIGVASAPRYNGIEPRSAQSFQGVRTSAPYVAPPYAAPSRPYATGPTFSGGSGPSAPPSMARAPYNPPSAPSFSRSSPSFSSSPSYSRPSYSPPASYSSPSFSRSSPSVSSPSFSRPSSPSFTPSVSRPSSPSMVRPSAPSMPSRSSAPRRR